MRVKRLPAEVATPKSAIGKPWLIRTLKARDSAVNALAWYPSHSGHPSMAVLQTHILYVIILDEQGALPK